ncbi:pre-mRNA polyadenylation factor fip1, partial [Striga asiatica]
MEPGEINDDDQGLRQLCAEILENWNKPIYTNSGHKLVNENLFTLHEQRYSNSSYHDIQRDELSLQDSKTVEDVSKKIGGYELAKDADVITRLVADTFYDRVLGCCVDGIDLASLNKVKEAKASQEGTKDRRLSQNSSSSVPFSNWHSHQAIAYLPKCNFLVSTWPGDNWQVHATNYSAPTFARSVPAQGLVAKSRFRLPPYKTIFDVNIDHLWMKLWRNPGADVSDYFNYGLDEKQWKNYCKLEEGADETKSDNGNNKSVNSINSTDSNLCDPDIITEVTPHESFYNRSVCNSRKKPRISHKMIDGDNISPFPADSYSAQDSNNSEIETKLDGLVENNVEEDTGNPEKKSRE